MVGIVVKRYEHFNRAMGKYITSRQHYEREMAKGGYIPFAEAEKIASKARAERDKPYKLSEKARAVIESAKQSSDRKGQVKLSGNLIRGMKEVGVNWDSQWLPKHYQGGGFEDGR